MYTRLLTLFSLLALSAMVSAQPSVTTGQAKTLRVDNYTDDGSEGTLRWAIEKNNQDPGHYKIKISPMGEAPFVIEPTSPLPPILGPVTIEGSAWKHNGEYIAIDGSAYIQGEGTQACPGAVEGQYGTNIRTTTDPGLVLRDTHSVEITGLEIRNFCIGILINRASNNLIHDNRIVANNGGAGIMLTGDDGEGNPTATTTNNNKVLRNQLIDNGDGLELTRGAAFNLVADNLFQSTSANPEPSQGIEILWGNDNTVVRNRFENYSDGLQINWGNRNYIASNILTDNSIGVSLSGNGNTLDSNIIYDNRIGVALRPEEQVTANRLTANRIWNNSKNNRRCEAGGSCISDQDTGAIVFGVPGLEHASFVGSRGIGVDQSPSQREKICMPGTESDSCQTMPNRNQPTPLLSGLQHQSGERQLTGEVRGEPNSYYRVEIFANRQPGGVEAEQYLGKLYTTTDANGQGSFVFPLKESISAQTVTATATTPDGATSELSEPLPLD